ncbi:hypothetical protein GGR57DRAFT_487482 [Xylariaceae sp. FL1272]|nr:hypothetical protein GGR57DRAFT_487482 [Xylariaceae sp. FL1272]
MKTTTQQPGQLSAMDKTTVPPFIWINGYPGVGKLTVARELCTMLEKSKVLDNHLLIDPVAAVFDREDPEYQPARTKIRRMMLDSIVESKSKEDITWIFTDQRSGPAGQEGAEDYQRAALAKGAPFIPVILDCDREEHFRRFVGDGRGKANTKLTDPAILSMILEGEETWRFRIPYELELDVTHLTAEAAARKICEHVRKLIRMAEGTK